MKTNNWHIDQQSHKGPFPVFPIDFFFYILLIYFLLFFRYSCPNFPHCSPLPCPHPAPTVNPHPVVHEYIFNMQCFFDKPYLNLYVKEYQQSMDKYVHVVQSRFE